jgi:hypothetical protein
MLSQFANFKNQFKVKQMEQGYPLKGEQFFRLSLN